MRGGGLLFHFFSYTVGIVFLLVEFIFAVFAIMLRFCYHATIHDSCSKVGFVHPFMPLHPCKLIIE